MRSLKTGDYSSGENEFFQGITRQMVLCIVIHAMPEYALGAGVRNLSLSRDTVPQCLS